MRIERSSAPRSSGIAGSVARHRRPLITMYRPSSVYSGSSAISTTLTHVLTCKQRLAYCLGMPEEPGVAELFKALSDQTRRVILDELVLRDEQTLFELCTRLISTHGLSSSRQAVSQHLDVLEAAGLVRAERKGRYKFLYLDTGPLTHIGQRWPTTERN